MKLISIDAETNGLHGQAFAIGGVATDDDGRIIDSTLLRCPIVGPVQPWVKANVLPAVEAFGLTHQSYGTMLDTFRAFLERNEGFVAAHVTWPVEARLLLDTYPDGGGPFPLIDVAGALLAHGHDPTCVDAYLQAQDALPEGFGSPHNPLYDAIAAERCMRLLASARTRA